MISVLAPRLQISLSEICRHVWESFKLTYKGFGTELWLTFHCVIFQVSGRGCLFFPSPVQKLRNVLINLYFYLLRHKLSVPDLSLLFISAKRRSLDWTGNITRSFRRRGTFAGLKHL